MQSRQLQRRGIAIGCLLEVLTALIVAGKRCLSIPKIDLGGATSTIKKNLREIRQTFVQT